MDNETSESGFLGIGWAFPVAVRSDGSLATVAEEEDVREAVLIILGTAPGERVMRPDFGTGIHALVFEPITTSLLERVRLNVTEALIKWEPRIDNIEVKVETMRAVGKLMIHVTYRIRATNTFYNLVYPFYLQEGEPE